MKKQFRTTLLLLVLVAVALWGITLLPVQKAEDVTVSTETDAVQQAISEAVARYQTRGESDMAAVRQTAADTIPQKAELVVRGLPDPETTKNLLDAFANSGITAAFFVTGQDVAGEPASLALLVERGFMVGLDGADGADSSSPERNIDSFISAASAVQTAAGVWPSQLLYAGTPGDTLCAAAYACSMNTVVVPTQTVSLSRIRSQTDAETLLKGVQRGSILCVVPDGDTSVVGTAVTALCAALEATDLNAQAQKLLNANPAEAEPLNRVYTVEPAVAFTFSGLGNDAELQGVLDALSAVKAKATFFVTRDEIARYADEIHLILNGGHSLGIAVQTGRFTTAEALLRELMLTRESLQTDFEDTDALPVRPAFGSANALLKQACGAGGFTLANSMVNAVRTEDARATDAATVLAAVLPDSQGDLQRGEIVHFQMGQYQKSNTLLGELVKMMATQRNVYALEPLMTIADNAASVYTYPLPDAEILPEVKDKIFPGQLTGNAMSAIESRYIGVSWVATSAFLPGFSYGEIKLLDKKGLIPNNDNMVFLTFDDWGTDRTITRLLEVLKAHGAKATFFVKTQYVPYNPNLLRAIAADGHTIGCHTNTHFPLSNDVGSGKRFTELSEEQVASLQEDLVTSYGVLQSIVGDMRSGDHPSLSLLFRPPTLAISKSGLTTVLDCGFHYSVSGSFASQDYKATSAEKLAANLAKNTKSGAILVMHMSDNSTFTADALDQYLTEMEQKYADTPYRFVGLSEVLQ